MQSRGVIRGAIKRRHQRSSEVEDLAAAHRARVAKAALPRAVSEARGDDRRDRRACLMRGAISMHFFSDAHSAMHAACNQVVAFAPKELADSTTILRSLIIL